MSTAWEKFQGAIFSLTRSGTLKDRLDEAYRNYLAFVLEDDVPRESREDLRQLHIAIRREQPTNRTEDCVRATIRKFSNDEAERIAETVVRIFSLMPRTVPMLVRNIAPAQVIPFYSAEEPEIPAASNRKHSV
jgi:hypothetical protein